MRGTKDHVVGEEKRGRGGGGGRSVINWQAQGVCDAPGWRLQAAGCSQHQRPCGRRGWGPAGSLDLCRLPAQWPPDNRSQGLYWEEKGKGGGLIDRRFVSSGFVSTLEDVCKIMWFQKIRGAVKSDLLGSDSFPKCINLFISWIICTSSFWGCWDTSLRVAISRSGATGISWSTPPHPHPDWKQQTVDGGGSSSSSMMWDKSN